MGERYVFAKQVTTHLPVKENLKYTGRKQVIFLVFSKYALCCYCFFFV